MAAVLIHQTFLGPYLCYIVSLQPRSWGSVTTLRSAVLVSLRGFSPEMLPYLYWVLLDCELVAVSGIILWVPL